MPEVRRILVFSLNELTGKAREKALSFMRELESDFINENIKTLYHEELEARGYPTESIEFSLSHNQGDGMAFYGRIEEKALKEVAHKNTEWCAKLIERLMRHFTITSQLVNLVIKRTPHGYHYSHYNSMYVDVEWLFDTERHPRVTKCLMNMIDRLSGDIKITSATLEREGYKIIDEMTEEEVLCNGADANGIMFTHNGRVAPEACGLNETGKENEDAQML